MLLKHEGINRLDPGEVQCIALAKHTADQRMRYVLFLTDDYDAGEAAKCVLEKYQSGFVLRTADLVVFFGIRLNLQKPEIHQSLRNLISFYTDLYDSVLQQVNDQLVHGRGPYAVSLIRQGDFLRAKQIIAALPLSVGARKELGQHVDELIKLSGDTSTLSHCLVRLRALERLQL